MYVRANRDGKKKVYAYFIFWYISWCSMFNDGSYFDGKHAAPVDSLYHYVQGLYVYLNIYNIYIIVAGSYRKFKS